MNIATSLNGSVRAQRLGVVYAAETGFLLATTPDTVRAPDVAFVSRERLARQGEVEGYWPGAPDLVVEVISLADRYADVEDPAGRCRSRTCSSRGQRALRQGSEHRMSRAYSRSPLAEIGPLPYTMT